MGMHRSGTSLVMGLLSKCGVYIGNNLLMGARDNPKGHFEDRGFLRTNDQLLRRNGGSWKTPPDGVSYQGMKPQMEKFLEAWPKDKIVGWKDPRICLTFPLWKRLIEPEPIKVILTYRPIEQIAASLQARNGFTMEKGRKLAKYYYDQATRNTRRIPGVSCMITHFESYFSNWQLELEGVLEFLKLEMGDHQELADFIDRELWHNRGAEHG